MVVRRFQVAEDSMRPGLVPGDEIAATDSRIATTGDLVVFLHPHREDFWMVKRVGIPPEDLPPDAAWVVSDNPDVTRADSRTLGPIALDTLWPVVTTLDETTFSEATTLLAGEDAILAGIINDHGIPDFWVRPPGFATMVHFILEQQVSLASAAAVLRRVEAAIGSVTPEAVLVAGAERLSGCGVTRQKAGYMLSIAERLANGSFSFEALATMAPVEARHELLKLKGVGPWTADVYLLAVLGSPDAFPIGDRALQVGVAEAAGMKQIPDPDALAIIAEPWRPLRAAAARLIWHSYLMRRDRVNQ